MCTVTAYYVAMSGVIDLTAISLISFRFGQHSEAGYVGFPG